MQPWICLLFFSVVFVDSLTPPRETSLSPRTSLTNTSKPLLSSSTKKNETIFNSNNATIPSYNDNTIETTETEIWNGRNWDPTNVSTFEVPLPKHASKWITGWMLSTSKNVSSSSAETGWKYLLTQSQQAIRQRKWTRMYASESSTIKKKKGSNKRKQRRALSIPTTGTTPVTAEESCIHTWLQAIRDEWNFKGFGFTFYKSLISWNTFGCAFRLPLTFNLDSFERNPALPSMSMSLSLYYPWSLIFFINISLRLEFIKWAARRAIESCAGIMLLTTWACLMRSIAISIAVLLFPVTRHWPELSAAPQSLKHMVWGKPGDRIPFSRTTEERLGCSVSWRISQLRGYEFRTSCWHLVAPTLTSIWESIPVVKKSIPPTWFLRRSAAVGFSTGVPTPDPPNFSGSAILVLSGFHFHDLLKKRIQKGNGWSFWREEIEEKPKYQHDPKRGDATEEMQALKVQGS